VGHEIVISKNCIMPNQAQTSILKSEPAQKTVVPETAQLEPVLLPDGWVWAGSLDGLPDHGTTRLMRQVGVLKMQQQYGNSRVQRFLSTGTNISKTASPDIQRCNGDPSDCQGTAIPYPTLRISPTALTVGMGEQVSLNAEFNDVKPRDIEGASTFSSRGIYTVPKFPDASKMARERKLTFYASESGTLRVSFNYRGEIVESNNVTITVEDPTFLIEPDTSIVDKGGQEHFNSRVQGIFNKGELGATIGKSDSNIHFIPEFPDIDHLTPRGSLKAYADDAGTFSVGFTYFGRYFESNPVAMGIIEPALRISADWPHYYIGQPFDVKVSSIGFGDLTRLGNTMVTPLMSLETIGSLPEADELVPGGNIPMRMIRNEADSFQLGIFYLDQNVLSNRIQIRALSPLVLASPMELSVGLRQRFPVQYQLLGFYQPDEITGVWVSYTAPISMVEHMKVPTAPDESGQAVLEANDTAGAGAFSFGLQYLGQNYESPYITINVTPGPSTASTPDRIYFDTDKDEIRPDAAASLMQVAQRLKDEPSLIARLEGHADTRHTDEYNARLSIRRAKSTRNYLMDVLGVNGSQIPEEEMIGWGEAFPTISPETNPAEFQANRRVEIILAESSTGKELLPSVQLNPHTIRVGVGQTFSLGFNISNVHERDRYGGSSLAISGQLNQESDSVMPSLPGGETGHLVLVAGNTPGQATVNLGIFYGGTFYDSNTVQVVIVEPSLVLSPERWDDLEIGDFFAIQYVLDNFPNPAHYEGSVIMLNKTDGGDVILLRGQLNSITGKRMVDGLQMHATQPGEVRLIRSIIYNGRQYNSNEIFMKIHPRRYRNFKIRQIGGGEGGEVIGGGYYTFELKEVGEGGRTAVIRFAGAGLTGGLPGGGFFGGSWSSFTTTVPMRIENFEGGGRIASIGANIVYGGGYQVLHFYCGDFPPQMTEGWGHGWGLSLGGSWFHGDWTILNF
jgi:outer membrane protein OmpA-like peptidoglycan-associated protein